MFALPGQTTAELEEDLRAYLALAPEHLSCYGLTAEPDTPLQQRIISGELTLPDEGFYADAFLLIHDQLASAGYEHYEIANYARDGYTCRHNRGYWQRRPYLGIGAGAHSFCDDQWGSRWEVPADMIAYRQALVLYDAYYGGKYVPKILQQRLLAVAEHFQDPGNLRCL